MPGDPPGVVPVEHDVARAEDLAAYVAQRKGTSSSRRFAFCYAVAFAVRGGPRCDARPRPRSRVALQSSLALAIYIMFLLKADGLQGKRGIGFYYMAVLVWVDVALLLHYIAGLDTSPTKVSPCPHALPPSRPRAAAQVSALHVFIRVCLIAGGATHWLAAACAGYYAFAMLFVYHVVRTKYPVTSTKTVLREELLAVRAHARARAGVARR